MDSYQETFVFPKDWTEEQKELAKDMLRMRAESLNSVCVVYKTICGCDIKIDFLLDRFPMSPKIHTQCVKCKRYVLAEISDPIIFYLKLTDTEYMKEDLKSMHITESRQKWLLERYIDL